MADTPQDKGVNSLRNIKQFSPTNRGEFNVDSRTYPMDLVTAPDKQHYVTFFINVRGKSKVFSDYKPAERTKIDASGQNRIKNEDINFKLAGAAGGAIAGGLAGLSIGKIVGKAAYQRSRNLGGTSKQAAVTGALSTIGGGVGGAAVGAAAGAATGGAVGLALDLIVDADSTYRIADAISLHISDRPSVQYSADYDNIELGPLIGITAGGSSAVDTKGSDFAAELGRALAIGIAKMPGNLVSGGGLGKAIELKSGQSLNPYREVLFQSIGFRKFAFDYKFMPKNEQEAANVYEIIKTFKYHMHPELSKGGLYYIHPSEFQIQYYFAGQENTYFNKISTCVLEDMQVDYGSNEGFSTFRDGSPVEINMRLVFRELETLSKERIDEGY